MKGKSKIKLALWTLLLMVAIPLSAYGADGQIKITQPTEPPGFPIPITESGSYVLTSDLVVAEPDPHAIQIDVNDVTLDLNGHKIQGPQGGEGCGIYAKNHYSITIKNGRIWGFKHGIYLYSDSNHPSFTGAGHRVEGIQALNNPFKGIYVMAGVITNCTANNNGDDGINATNSTVTNCTANNNGGDGIEADGSTVTNCTANNNNGDDGIEADDNSTVTNCTANGNYGNGIYADYSTVTNCTANDNRVAGIRASYSTVKGCNVRYTTDGWGIYTDYGWNNYIYRNVASGNKAGQLNCPTGNICVDNAVFPIP